MTQRVSSGSHDLPNDVSCDDPCAIRSESSTCDETLRRDRCCSTDVTSRVTASHPITTLQSTEDFGEDSPFGLRFCRRADTVIEGFLCNEPTVVSNACRNPKNEFDAYVCDEPRMHALQRSIVDQTLSFLKSILLALARAKP